MPINEGTLYKIIQDTWTSTLGFQVDRPVSAEFLAARTFTVCVKITGAWNGEVRLNCSAGLARLITAAIFKVEAEKTGNDEILDALSELIHIVGGNLKALLPQPAKLSLPSLGASTDWMKTAPQRQRVCRLALMSEGHPFVVTLLGDLHAPENEEASFDGETRVSPENL